MRCHDDEFRGRRLVFFLMLGGIASPWPGPRSSRSSRILGAVDLLNTFWAVILPQVPAVIAVFVFKQFFDGLPRDFEESARIDGAGFWRIYRSIVMPLSRPVVSAISIITFVTVWNNLILPLFVLSNPKLMTIPVGLATVQGSYGQRFRHPGLVAARCAAVGDPVLIFQKRIVEGVTGSAVKGLLVGRPSGLLTRSTGSTTDRTWQRGSHRREVSPR